ncbi:hypothetical protein [Echinicola strongylocentroti]|nr:hypothetical protein [Echinicola strongylocentroti]
MRNLANIHNSLSQVLSSSGCSLSTAISGRLSTTKDESNYLTGIGMYNQ